MTIALILLFFKWHLVDAPLAIAGGAANILWFNFHYFSLGTLLRTLLAPWRRQEWSYQGGFHPGEYLEMVISNGISRILGGVVRSCVIALSLFSGLLLLFLAFGAVAFWYLFPFLTIFALFHGFRILL